MKSAAIIAEYDPFHNGHLYHIQETRELGATHIVCVMSGNLTQRGEIAAFSKFARAQAACLCGADLVIELPAAYACAPANRFADGAVAIIKALGGTDMLSFGCESGSVDAIERASELILNKNIGERVRRLVSQGVSYPRAVHTAIEELDPDVAEIVSRPNDTLAVEYLSAAKREGLACVPVAIKREGAMHNDLSARSEFASGSCIRGLVTEGKNVAHYLPPQSLSFVNKAREDGLVRLGLGKIESAVLFRMRTMTDAEFLSIPDSGDGLADRIKSAARTACSLDELYTLISTKRYTAARVRRAVLCAVLGIDKGFYSGAPYLRVLAMNRRGAELLKNPKRTLRAGQSLKELETLSGYAAKCAALEAKISSVCGLCCDNVHDGNEEFTRKFALL